MSFEEERHALVAQLAGRENLSEQTKAAMREVPRHEFVPESKRKEAYRDRPLPIGEGQTISAPHMVAIMTERLDLSPGDRVLEIGTGCGYHAAVTAEVVGAENVYSVEYHESLAKRAMETLARIGYGGISLRAGDGRDGWPEYAPYDRIYLTCAANDFPAPLVSQLRGNGIILGPLGDVSQILTKARKTTSGLERETHGRVRFVPLQ